MYICYIDESGTSSIPGNTSHFVLAGLSIPIWHWKDCEHEVGIIKARYALDDSEIHVGWLLRPYLEQSKINNFDQMDYRQRRSQVESQRRSEILRLQRSKNTKQLKQTKKNFELTKNYIHLNYNERCSFAKEIAQCISGWGFSRLFAECIDKIYFDPQRTLKTVDEQSFEQVVSRFEQYLENIGRPGSICYGLLIHDNNETVAKKHTTLMKKYHQTGTLWTQITSIIETPLFVDSQLTSMVQIADVCAYALRRYLENGEEELFDLVFSRADRVGNCVVGVRHYTHSNCTCKICQAHRKGAAVYPLPTQV